MRVFLTQEIDEAGTQILSDAGVSWRAWPGPGPMPRGELLRAVVGCDGLISMLTDRVDGELMGAGPLKVVAQHAVGIDNIDLAAARAAGVVVCHTPGVLTEATADMAMALMLAVGRHLLPGDQYLRAGRFVGWRPTLFRGIDLYGARLGIVGKGRIGSAVAARARAFGMDVVHTSRSGGLPLRELLETSDVVSLHCPLTPETRGLIGARELGWMKPSAILINTARGPVVDEAALVTALRAGALAGAGLDVFEREPQVHVGLVDLPNVVLLPHLGSATWGTRRRMAVLAAEGLVAALRGEEPVHRVG